MLDLDYQKLGAMSDGNSQEERRIAQWFDNFKQTLSHIYNCPELELTNDRKNKNFKIIIPNREPFGLNEMADGYSALLKIVMELMVRMESQTSGSYDMPGIALIDEIETYLHVEMQKRCCHF